MRELICGGNRQLVVGKKGQIKRPLKNNRKRVGVAIGARDPGALVLLGDQ